MAEAASAISTGQSDFSNHDKGVGLDSSSDLEHNAPSERNHYTAPERAKASGVNYLQDDEWMHKQAREIDASVAEMEEQTKQILVQAEATIKEAAVKVQLIRAQTEAIAKKEAAKEDLIPIEKEKAAAKAKQAQEHQSNELVRQRRELVNLGTPMEDIDKWLPLPPGG